MNFCGAACLLLAASALPILADTVDYTTVANGRSPSLALGGTTVTGSADIRSGLYAGFRGLGVVGGGSNLTLDPGETLTITYPQPVDDVTLTVVDVDPVGNATLAFTAFDGPTDLGRFLLPNATTAPETYLLSALTGNQALTAITLDVTDAPPIGFQIQATSFEAATSPIPEPSTLILLGTGLLGAARIARRTRP